MKLELIIGIVASLFSAVSLVPQLFKLIKEKKAENISMPMLLILFAGLSGWIYYVYCITIGLSLFQIVFQYLLTH